MVPRRQLLHGFTLIELLIVIAIILLLVSILLPSLNKARELAKSMVCLTRLKGIGVAQLMYAGDYNGFATPILQNFDEISGLTWTRILMSLDYGTSEELYQCPAESKNMSLPYQTYGLQRAYAYWGPWQIYTDPVVTTTEMATNYPDYYQRPADTFVMVADTVCTYPTVYGEPNYYFEAYHEGYFPMALRHQGKGNGLFIDGHVESMNKERLLNDLGFVFVLSEW